MNCYYCGASLDFTDTCPECESNVRLWKRINGISNRLYNDGLSKAKVRDLSGAAESLKMSLRYNKMNTNARNLLGLVYYEMGESVNALSEWVISKSLVPEENQASEYLSAIQKSAAQLENTNQTIKKFNQALTYCQQGNYDLAVIQLKKVLSLSPKMVKGHQLLALLYMREERYDLAMRSLHHAEKIDANNTNTMRYVKECREHLRANGKLKPSKEEDTVTYQSGNDIIIRPAKITDHTAVRTVVNLLIGAAIGVAVVSFLIIPEIKQRANAEASVQVVEANQTISAREQTIQTLEEQIESLNRQVEDAEAATASADEKTASYSELLDAYVSYAAQNYEEAWETLSGTNKDLLDESARGIYEDMLTNVQIAMVELYYNEAMAAYEQRDYESAIEKFRYVTESDEGYEDGKAAYYLAFACKYIEDYDNALKWFRITIENTSSRSRKNTSTQMAEELEAQGYSVPE